MPRFFKGRPPISKRLQFILAALILSAFGCAVSHTRRIARSALPAPPETASLAQLIAKINAQSAAVNSLTSIVDLAPSTGSEYSGFTTQYHDVKGFLLLRRPAFIRMTGQAPVVRTDIFDMASDGKQFELYIPSEAKFYVGKTGEPQKPGKKLQNLRPQHVIEALLLAPADPAARRYFIEQVDAGSERDYVVGEIDPAESGGPGDVRLKRMIWFDRSNLQISRVAMYDGDGAVQENVEYSDYQSTGGVEYPWRIEIRRPVEDYTLVINLLQPRFNSNPPLSKFDLKRPPNATLIDLSAPSQAGPAGESGGQ